MHRAAEIDGEALLPAVDVVHRRERGVDLVHPVHGDAAQHHEQAEDDREAEDQARRDAGQGAARHGPGCGLHG
jgi:hypothetical protein